MDMGFCIGVMSWPRLECLCKNHVVWVYQKYYPKLKREADLDDIHSSQEPLREVKANLWPKAHAYYRKHVEHCRSSGKEAGRRQIHITLLLCAGHSRVEATSHFVGVVVVAVMVVVVVMGGYDSSVFLNCEEMALPLRYPAGNGLPEAPGCGLHLRLQQLGYFRPLLCRKAFRVSAFTNMQYHYEGAYVHSYVMYVYACMHACMHGRR